MVIHKKGEFELEFVGDCDSIVSYLEALKKGLETSELVIGNHRKKVLFEPKGLINVKIKVKRRDRENKITLKFQWRDNGRAIKKNKQKFVIEKGANA